jgi:hypothetical protein
LVIVYIIDIRSNQAHGLTRTTHYGDMYVIIDKPRSAATEQRRFIENTPWRICRGAHAINSMRQQSVDYSTDVITPDVAKRALKYEMPQDVFSGSACTRASTVALNRSPPVQRHLYKRNRRSADSVEQLDGQWTC